MQSKLLVAYFAVSAMAGIVPRQTDISDLLDGELISEQCQSVLVDIASYPIPTPGPELQDAMPTNTADACNYTPPASASSAWKSYTEEAKSFAEEHDDLFKKLKKECNGSAEADIADFSQCKGDSDNGGGQGSASAAMAALLAAGAAAVVAL
ncbi:hypothetical protein K4F52_007213 [Lecanicillium sp. MT-2017a]|nr:hypothetical protein K4F52_007213 [Lecanicillium sp. MT-2017a]